MVHSFTLLGVALLIALAVPIDLLFPTFMGHRTAYPPAGHNPSFWTRILGFRLLPTTVFKSWNQQRYGWQRQLVAVRTAAGRTLAKVVQPLGLRRALC